MRSADSYVERLSMDGVCATVKMRSEWGSRLEVQAEILTLLNALVGAALTVEKRVKIRGELLRLDVLPLESQPVFLEPQPQRLVQQALELVQFELVPQPLEPQPLELVQNPDVDPQAALHANDGCEFGWEEDANATQGVARCARAADDC